MRIGITGAAGFIGSALAERLHLLGHEVFGFDSFDSTLYSSDTKKMRGMALRSRIGLDIEVLDLAKDDLTNVFDGLDVVVNQAAIPGLAPSWGFAPQYFQSNTIAVSRLLTSVSRSGAYLVQASTSSVYGKYAEGDELLPTKPVSPYGASKLAAENLITGFSQEEGIKYSILRYFSVYGPNQRPDMAYSKFCKWLLEGKEITVFGDGLQSRTNTYIDDLVDATVRTVEAQPENEIFNVSGSDEISVLEAIQVLAQELDAEPKLSFAPKVKGDQVKTEGNSTKIQSLLNWSPKTGIIEGLKKQAQAAKASHA